MTGSDFDRTLIRQSSVLLKGTEERCHSKLCQALFFPQHPLPPLKTRKKKPDTQAILNAKSLVCLYANPAVIPQKNLIT